MRNYLKILLALFIGINTNGSAQSLDKYLEEAAENNPLLKAKYSEFQAAIQRVAQMNSLPNPSISFSYLLSPVTPHVGNAKANIGIQQMIPWFGTLETSGNVYQLQSEALYQEFINERNQLFMEVKSAWYPLYELHQEIKLQKENKKVLLSYKQLATTGFKVGKNSMADVLRVDIKIESTTTEIKLLEEKIKPFTVRFNRLLNKSDTAAIEIEETIQLAEIPLNYRRDSLLENHPSLKALDLEYQSAQASETLANKEGAPSFGVGLDYGFMPDAQNMVMPMVSISLPIYRNRYKALKKEAHLKQEAISFYKKDFENELISNYEMTRYELDRAKEKFLLYQQQIERTKQVIHLLEVEYSNSGDDFEEILRMQQDLINYQIGKATAVKDFFTALAKLDYLTAKSE
ncbi:TolC family protein [Brumimicrobium aurantiacum]|uniref:TolC family protein n=1 Tax=Brumimicrobium aurantiacum TaxID=1737063 RepID=A0A3E1EU59_9FLAO|nr:TolC family protein [Brumimicrobium aurantiacum]RFC53096.1 TolC family protein [Brumimicrobium aurantiacum]